MLLKPIVNDFYEIGYDTTINRMYLRIKGFWKSQDQVPAYVQDIEDICNKLKPGFTLLTDLRQMKIPPVEVNKLHAEAQQLTRNYGLRATAELVQEKDLVLTTVLKTIATESGMKKKEFTSMKEGEAWLDQV